MNIPLQLVMSVTMATRTKTILTKPHFLILGFIRLDLLTFSQPSWHKRAFWSLLWLSKRKTQTKYGRTF